MALARNRRSQRTVDYWPGFVDALSTLLLAIMFLLTVFVLAQFFLSREISGKDDVLNRLTSQINELTQLLALEKSGTIVNSWLCSTRANLPLDSWTVPVNLPLTVSPSAAARNGKPLLAASSAPTRATSRSRSVARRLRR